MFTYGLLLLLLEECMSHGSGGGQGQLSGLSSLPSALSVFQGLNTAHQAGAANAFTC